MEHLMIPLLALSAGTLMEAALQNPPTLAKLQPVPFTAVEIRDRFWSPRQETNRSVSVHHSLEMLERAGNFLVMKLAAEGKREGFKGLLFTDSDLYKTLEGIAYTLATHPDPALDRRFDEIVAMIAAAQMPDGYLNTWFQVTRPDDRFKNLRDWHEIYCAGHLFEAAAAHFQATGKRNLLDVALKFADLLDRRYGPQGSLGYCGHPEAELALVKLWQVTGDRRWFELGRKMTETRGSKIFAREHGTPLDKYEGVYWLDDVPIAEHREIKGHAVRAAYLMSGAADIARETGSPELLKMLKRVWRNATEKRVFVTGGIGPSAHNEGFTVDYDLPNQTAYQETCASIAMAQWGHRMALLFGDASYIDAAEAALYNALLSGVGLDGKSFFYVNPLASDGNHHRRDWYECACCPPNVLRTIASLGGYGYASSKDSLFVNLYLAGSVRTKVGDREVALEVKTDYPWDGKVEIEVQSEGEFALRLRNPGWCVGAQVAVNGEPLRFEAPSSIEKGYFVLRRSWKKGDRVTLDLPMPVRQLEAHPWVKDDLNRTAVRRGPLVYCAEQLDNEAPLAEVVLPRGAKFESGFRKDLLGGVVVLRAEAEKIPALDWDRKLYQPVAPSERVALTMVPYGFWDNRKQPRPPGPTPLAMQVWFPIVPPPAKVLGPEGRAKVTVSFRSGNAQIWGVNDGVEPSSSGEQPKALCHFWPHKGGQEWVQYTWEKPIRATGAQVYWFDDTGRGECRLPASWKLQALRDGGWVDVALREAPIALDKWCEARFDPVETTALRLVVDQQRGWASGIHEWKVLVEDES
jgi:uncharacterized protein